MKNYRLNENGVCVNPDEIQVYSDINIKIYVKYAFYSGNWAYGVDILYANELGFGGVSFSPSFAKEGYISFVECEKNAYNFIINYFSELKDTSIQDSTFKAIDSFFNKIQLSFFYSWATALNVYRTRINI